MVTPEEVREKATLIDAILEMFEGKYLHYLDLLEEAQRQEGDDRNKGTTVFYHIRDLLGELVKETNELADNMVVCNAILASRFVDKERRCN